MSCVAAVHRSGAARVSQGLLTHNKHAPREREEGPSQLGVCSGRARVWEATLSAWSWAAGSVAVDGALAPAPQDGGRGSLLPPLALSGCSCLGGHWEVKAQGGWARPPGSPPAVRPAVVRAPPPAPLPAREQHAVLPPPAAPSATHRSPSAPPDLQLPDPGPGCRGCRHFLRENPSVALSFRLSPCLCLPVSVSLSVSPSPLRCF